MRVIVTGANGQVGWELQQTKPENIQLFAFNSQQLDITNPDQINKRFSEVRPDVVINAAAYTAVDKAEEEPEKAYAVNAIGAENLAKACLAYNARLIHISTDFVFDGEKSTPYTPEDKPNPINVYGASKLKGEQLVQEILNDYLIVRTSWVYSTHGNNFVKTMLSLMSKKDQLSIVSDQVGSPTYARNLARWIWKAIYYKVKSGLYHFSDQGVISWFDFAKEIQKKASIKLLRDKDIRIRPIFSEEFSTKAQRPRYSVLEMSSLETEELIFQENWRLGLKKMLENLSVF